jgi:predicted outer membrane protein
MLRIFLCKAPKMKRIIAILLLSIAILIGLIYFWPGPVSKAEYQPEPAFTTEDQLFVQRAYTTLRAAIAMDNDAEARSHDPKVRDLAQRDELEQKDLLLRLKQIVDAIDPDFRLESAKSAERRKLPSGVAFDKSYLENFIQIREQASVMLNQASSIQDNPSIKRFAALWRSSIQRQLADARGFSLTEDNRENFAREPDGIEAVL